MWAEAANSDPKSKSEINRGKHDPVRTVIAELARREPDDETLQLTSARQDVKTALPHQLNPPIRRVSKPERYSQTTFSTNPPSSNQRRVPRMTPNHRPVSTHLQIPGVLQVEHDGMVRAQVQLRQRAPRLEAHPRDLLQTQPG